MEIFRFSLTLRLWHPTITADQMGAALGVQGKTSDKRDLQTGEHYNYWRSEGMSGADREILTVLDRMLAKLEQRSDFLDSFSETGGRMEFFVGWFQSRRSGGETFDHRLLARLSRLHIDLSLDVYGTGEEPDAGDVSEEILISGKG